MEGLYTPRYETYAFSVSGLPFKPSKITADGKNIKDFAVNADKILEFKYSKNFKKIEISK
jgi:alpha-glucosidase